MSRLLEGVRLSFGAALLLLTFAAAPARAQCPLADTLDCGACWQQAHAQLPQFPAFAQDVLDICWHNCQPESVGPCRASWSQPRPAKTAAIPPLCSVYLSRLTLSDAAGVVKWTGVMRLWYSRTWIESGAGTRFQVWRFLANGDLRPRAGLGVPCPVPPCAAAFANKVHFWGYLDYAQDCVTSQFSEAWSVTHECDGIDHAPGFPRAGAFHPDRSYTFVGPAAGFVVSPIEPDEAPGALAAEDFRPLNLALLPASGDICIFEEKLQQGFLDLVQRFCLCGPASGPAQYTQSTVNATGVCGTVLTTDLSGFPPGLISKGIGHWTDATKYPGPEILRLNVAGYRYADQCRPRNRAEIFYGVTTLQGFAAFSSTCTSPGGGAPLPLTFIDQGNALRFPGFAPIMNFKYVTDIILNLNR